MFGQGYAAVTGEEIDWYGLLSSFIGLPLFAAIWIGYKLKHKTKVVPLGQCKLTD